MKRILISQRILPTEKGAPRDALEQDYCAYYESYDITLIPIPNATKKLDKYLKMDIQGIMLSGGNDICGYSMHGHRECSCMRDAIETQLLQFAIKNSVPILAECRGCQFLNIFFGGSLITNLTERIENNIGHVGTTHLIEICDAEFESYLQCSEAEVNSFHEHGITEQCLSPHLRPFALSRDGVIEGVYHPSYPMIGIMWHPERMNRDELINSKIIERFISL